MLEGLLRCSSDVGRVGLGDGKCGRPHADRTWHVRLRPPDRIDPVTADRRRRYVPARGQEPAGDLHCDGCSINTEPGACRFRPGPTRPGSDSNFPCICHDPFDPFTAAYQAILGAFQNWPALAALVPAGNFVDTTDPLFQHFKPSPTKADTPQIKLFSRLAFTLPPFGGNSTSVRFTQAYRVMVCTDVLRVVPLNQVQ